MALGCAKSMHESDMEALEAVQQEIFQLSLESENSRRDEVSSSEGKPALVVAEASEKAEGSPPLLAVAEITSRGCGGPNGECPGVSTVTPPGKPDLPLLASEPHFDIHVESASTRDFFSGLVKGTPYNILVHPSVTGNISLDLKNVTVPEVIDVACNLYDFSCSKNDVGYQISPQSIQFRQFRLYYPNILRQGSSSTQVSSGQKSSSTTSTSSDKGSTEKKSEGVSGFGVTTGYRADFWAELTNTLCTLVGLVAKDVGAEDEKRNLSCQTDKKDQSGFSESVVPTLTPEPSNEGEIPDQTPTPAVEAEINKAISISPQTGVIMIRAFPSEIRQLKSVIDEMQGNLLQQVVLEAKILEVTLSDHYQTGINWSFVSRFHKGTNVIGAGQTGGGTAFEAPTLTNASDLNKVTAPQALEGVTHPMPFNSLGGIFAVGLALNDFQSFLELLKGQGNVSVLSSPRIATLNNQKAMIKVGVDDMFVTNIETKYDANGVPSTTVSFTPYFSGVALDVMPQIVGKDQLILHIHPSVSEATEKNKIVRGGDYPLASNNMRESDSLVFSNSGEVIVIGGLMKTVKKRGRQSVPFLGDIPVVGELFGHRLDTEEKTELVILMRATIVGKENFWRDELKAAQGRLESMKNPFPISAPALN